MVLKNRLQTNADSLSRGLQFLSDTGFVRRNPGYGHPLRPEYVLTPLGQSVAPGCSTLAAAVDRLQLAETVYCKWSLPLLVTIRGGVVRFGNLREVLGINPRALTQGLRRLDGARLLVQRTDYRLTTAGRRIAVLGGNLI